MEIFLTIYLLGAIVVGFLTTVDRRDDFPITPIERCAVLFFYAVIWPVVVVDSAILRRG